MTRISRCGYVCSTMLRTARVSNGPPLNVQMTTDTSGVAPKAIVEAGMASIFMDELPHEVKLLTNAAEVTPPADVGARVGVRSLDIQRQNGLSRPQLFEVLHPHAPRREAA